MVNFAHGKHHVRCVPLPFATRPDVTTEHQGYQLSDHKGSDDRRMSAMHVCFAFWMHIPNQRNIRN